MSSILDHFSSLRILVIGDLMLDHYVWGDVNRISPEAPVPVVCAERESWTAGGAANVALNLAGLGAETKLIGYIGPDEAGDKLRELLNHKGVELLAAAETQKSGAPTIIKTRIIARNQQVCRIDREQQPTSYELNYSPEFERLLVEAMHSSDAIILSNYAKGIINQEIIDLVFKIGKQHKMLIAIDPKPRRKLVMRGAGLMTPNRAEALELADFPEPRTGEPYPIDKIFAQIHKKYCPDTLIITLGSDGMAVGRAGKIEALLPTVAREVFDVSGAGDTVISVLTAALAAGASPTESSYLANEAAGVVVAHMGTVPITREEFESVINKGA